MVTTLAFVVLLFVGAPIGIVLALSAVAYIVSTDNYVLFASYPLQLFSGVDSYGLLAIPLFLLLGEIMNAGGLTQRLVGLAKACIGTLHGGLAYINIVANMLLASILGSTTAQISVMAKVMVPEMDREGYDRPFSVATTACAGLLSPIIPPSMMFVIYGVLAQVSIGDMFIAGIIPGILLGGSFLLVVFLIGLVRPYPQARGMPMSERLVKVRDGLATLSIPVVIIGSITTGIATPTESAAVACVAAWGIGRILTGEFNARALPEMLAGAGRNAALVLFMVATANVFSWVLIYGQVPQALAAWIQLVASGPVTFMLLVNVILLVVGTVIDGIPGLIMVVPILLPIATGIYGIDPYHFGVVVSINMVLGLVSPPVGIALYVAAAVTGMKAGEIFRAAIPYCLATCVVLVLLSVFPWFTTALLK
jgi:tripartite ATP-independent transporter DctM subunit